MEARCLLRRALFGPTRNKLKKESFWGSWCPFKSGNHFNDLSLGETLVGGQSFDWHTVGSLHWRGKIGRNIFECRWREGRAEWRCDQKTVRPKELIEEYFCLGEAYESSLDQLPWRSDPVLRRSIDKLKGLRILRQPMDQTLFFFILSSAKSIPQIQSVGEAVFQRFGEDLGEGIYSFPGWDRLSEIPEADLRLIKLGYRAKYVFQTAQFIKSRSGWLESIPHRKYTDAKKELMKLPGVGGKIADCVLLFGGHFLEAFPIDTWIEKSLENRYLLHGWSTTQKTHFARIHFGKLAGLAQQFLFSAERLGILDE